MPQVLKRSDLRAALDTVGAIGECADDDLEFARRGVDRLRRLVAADLTTLSICDLATNHRSVVSDVPGAISVTHIAAFDRHFHEHPLVRAHGRNPAAVSRRLTDLVPRAQFRRSPLYNDYYRPIRIEHALAVPIHVEGDELVSFVLNRSGRDFSDRDLACLETIRPHLGQLFRLSRELRGARSAWGMPPHKAADAKLTAREREVLQWLSGGKTDRDIATILGISPRTIHKHLQRIYDKLGVETRTAAVVRAMGG
jgi:DNA-binding CsgD family transcriptional regulator